MLSKSHRIPYLLNKECSPPPPKLELLIVELGTSDLSYQESPSPMIGTNSHPKDRTRTYQEYPPTPRIGISHGGNSNFGSWSLPTQTSSNCYWSTWRTYRLTVLEPPKNTTPSLELDIFHGANVSSVLELTIE